MTDQFAFVGEQVLRGGIFHEPRKLKVASEAVRGSRTFLADSNFDLRFTSYEHRWECNVFSCSSWYNVNAFILSLATGQKVLLNGVETAIEIRDQPPIDWDPKNGQYYRYFANVTDFYIGCGKKDGHDPDYWGVARAYFSSGEIISWRWTSHA